MENHLLRIADIVEVDSFEIVHVQIHGHRHLMPDSETLGRISKVAHNFSPSLEFLVLSFILES